MLFFLPLPKIFSSADRNVDFFRTGVPCVVCLLGVSLMTEYRTVLLSAGFVALLAGAETLDGDVLAGDVLLCSDLRDGDRDGVR